MRVRYTHPMMLYQRTWPPGGTVFSNHLILFYWVYLYSATSYNISMCFTSTFPDYRTGSFQYQISSLGSIEPCCHDGAGNYSSTQAFTVQPCRKRPSKFRFTINPCRLRETRQHPTKPQGVLHDQRVQVRALPLCFSCSLLVRCTMSGIREIERR